MSHRFYWLRRLGMGLSSMVALLLFLLVPDVAGVEPRAAGAKRLSAQSHDRLHTASGLGRKNARASAKKNTFPSVAASQNFKPLSLADEKAAKEFFARLQDDDVPMAQRMLEDMEGHILLPVMQAALYLHPRHTASFAETHDWLTAYADLPVASAVYEKATRHRGASSASLPRPRWKQGLSGNIEAASGAMPAEWKRSRFLSVVASVRKKAAEADQDNSGDEEVAQEDGKVHSISLARAEELFRKGDMAAVLGELTLLDGDAATSSEAAYGLWLKGLAAYSLGDMRLAQEAFAAASVANGLDAAARAAASFWAARAAEAVGDEGAANYHLKLAAEAPRSFYGKLALAALGASPIYNWDMPAYTVKHFEALMAVPAGARALALLQIGRSSEAERELRGIHPRGNKVLEEALLAFAGAASLPALSLQVAGALKKQGAAYDSALYPLPDKAMLEDVGSDAALVLAVARQESRFDASAKSPAGALGTMQIMPDTAEKMERGATARLRDAAYNLRLGDAYLQKLAGMKGIDGKLIYTLAAYNCGPGRLLELAARSHVHGGDPLLFIETIPIRETRHYVQKVLANFWAYQARFGQATPSARVLAEGRMPSFTPAARVASK